MNINGFELTDEVAKEINHLVFETLQEFDSHCDKLKTHGQLKRNFRDRLDELDLWDCTSIAEEYIRIKDHTSTLSRSLRDVVSTIFEAGIAKYIANHQNDKEYEIQ